MYRWVFFLLFFFNYSCSQGVICTTEFRQVYAEVYDLKGQLVELDDHQIINLATYEDLTDEIGGLIDPPTPGLYLIADDATYFKGQETIELLFMGVLNSEIVISEVYVIGRDECHIQLISGKEQIIIGSS